MRIGLDVDDVLLPCTSIVIDKLKEMGISCPWEETRWQFANLNHTEQQTAKLMVNTPATFQAQLGPLDGAQEFVRQLLARGHEVFFCTAVPLWEISHRGRQLSEFFPEVSHRNHIFTSNKSALGVDVLLDDAPHNIEDSNVPYPVVFDAPWNREVDGYNASGHRINRVDSYSQFLSFLHCMETGTWEESLDKRAEPRIICLVGPSASGKTALAEELVKTGEFVKPQSATTRQRREGEAEDAYYFLTEKDFEEFALTGQLVEQTQYNGHHYGLPFCSINKALTTGKDVVIPIDINGAHALKKGYPKQTSIIFVERPIKAILRALIDRDMPVGALLDRLASMKQEFENSSLCDYRVINCGPIEDVASVCQTLVQGIKEAAEM